MKQHKWHKEIKAWADGAEVETRWKNSEVWESTITPNWNSYEREYRIKPQPKEPKYIYLYQSQDDERLNLSNNEFNESPLWKYIGKIKLETEE